VDLILRHGKLSLGDAAATQDAPPAGPGAAGRFTKVTLSAQRQQTLTRDISLQLQMTWQMGNKNLDSSEKLSLGGPTSIPGYAGGEASGDRGVQAKVAVRWQFLPGLALSAFTDYGKLTLARDPIAGTTKNSKRLTDLGIAADWMITKSINASLIVAWAGHEVPSSADDDKPRLWATLGYSW
jgi:hemolysin activation/secretion protein